MVTISVELPKTELNTKRRLEINPYLDELYVDAPADETGRHVRVRRQFTAREAKVAALRLMRVIPEGVLELRQGEGGGLTELAHKDAPRQLGTALRMMGVAGDYLIRLLPDKVAPQVMIDGRPATELQVRGLNLDWQVAFSHARSLAYERLEASGLQTLGQLVVKTPAYLKDNGFTTSMVAEIQTVLAEYELELGMDVTGWPLEA